MWEGGRAPTRQPLRATQLGLLGSLQVTLGTVLARHQGSVPRLQNSPSRNACLRFGNSQDGSVVKNLPASLGDAGDAGSFPGSRSFPTGEGNGNSLQYSCLGNPMDREEPGGPQSVGSQRVRPDSATEHTELLSPSWGLKRRGPRLAR